MSDFRIINLGSGSKGNATVVSLDGRAILIDAGLGLRRLQAGLEGLSLEAILITHIHRDHLGPYAHRFGVPVMMDRANAKAARENGHAGLPLDVFSHKPFEIGPFLVSPIRLPHPGGRSWTTFGFAVDHEEKRFVYATDLGAVPSALREAVREADVVLLESNHDLQMERHSPRPRSLVNWVLSNTGHLSNDQAAHLLGDARRAHTVLLAHLSDDCNTPDLALRCARNALPRSTRVHVLRQKAPRAPVTL